MQAPQTQRPESAAAAIAAVVIVTVAIGAAVVIGSGEGQHREAEKAGQAGQAPAPERPRSRRFSTDRAALVRLAGKIAAPWAARRSAAGLFKDPLTGGAGYGYGQAMLGESLMREGARSGNRRLEQAGITAVTRTARRAARVNQPENPLQLLAIASAERWARRRLGADPGFRRSEASWRSYLGHWQGAAVGPKAEVCFQNPACWNNYKLLGAVAVLELLETGAKATAPTARLAQPDARARVMTVLTQDLTKAIGKRAQAMPAAGEPLKGLGILSDQPSYALAYHGMSVLGLARALDLLGAKAPQQLRSGFRHAMEAEAAFAAPDGDVTYMGRAQGESWALAATVYAARSCTRHFARSAPETAGRCLTLGRRALARLENRHGFRKGVLAIVPRLRRGPYDSRGLDHYARVMTFNGLTTLALGWAADEPAPEVEVKAQPLPLDGGGTFTDPDRGAFAASRHGDVWMAVHATGPKAPSTDLRYDFGLLALKHRGADGRWVDVLPQRPLTEAGHPPESMGPSVAGAVPSAAGIVTSPKTGSVTLKGPFAGAGGVRYQPLADGVRVTVTGAPGATYGLSFYLPPGQKKATRDGRELRTRRARIRLGGKLGPVSFTPGYASAYDAELTAYRRTVGASAAGRTAFTIRALAPPGPARPPAAPSP